MMNSGLDVSLKITGTNLDDLHIEECVDQWDYVDLGSAGKWMKYNLGSTTVEGYGDYYAWGEVDTYYTGSASSPTWKSGKTSGYAWQSYDNSTGFVEWSPAPYDSTTLVLKNEYDVIYQKSGGKFRMPTYDEMNTLSYLTNTWTSVNGVYGIRFTATNGNSIFIPASGFFNGSSLNYAGGFGYLWTSSLPGTATSYTSYAYCLEVFEYNPSTQYYYRYTGCPIRGIKIE